MNQRRSRPDVVGINLPPTPARARQLPTPTSSRRRPRTSDPSHPHSHRGSSPLTGPIDSKTLVPDPELSNSSQLPTPQTLPRKRKATPARRDEAATRVTDEGAEGLPSPPSPSGHTTFFLSTHTRTAPVPPRRRPGLLFAQQMGLSNPLQPHSHPESGSGTATAAAIATVAQTAAYIASSSSSLSQRQQFGPRLNGAAGAGIGMGGGLRTSVGQGRSVVDRLRVGSGLDAASSSTGHRRRSSGSISATGSRSPPTPGAETSHLPRGMKRNTEMGSPTASLRASSGSRKAPHALIDHDLTPGAIVPPTATSPDPYSPSNHGVHSAHDTNTHVPPSTAGTGLLSPPPTKRTVRVRDDRAEMERTKRREEMKRMMDEDENPFLTRPGEVVRPSQEEGEEEDKPFITYVFRGTKKTFLNPFRQLSAPYPASTLDPSDTDFDPHPCPAPRLLWPSATPGAGPSTAGASGPSKGSTSASTLGRKRTREAEPRTPSRRSGARGYEHSEEDADGEVDEEGVEEEGEDHGVEEEEEEEEEEEVPVRRGLLFGPGAMKRVKM